MAPLSSELIFAGMFALYIEPLFFEVVNNISPLKCEVGYRENGIETRYDFFKVLRQLGVDTLCI